MKLIHEAFADIKEKKLIYLALLLIVVFGLFLRSYNFDAPVIGYHNWKETHYLTEARNFAENGFFANGFFVPEYDYPAMSADLSGAHPDSFPFISIVVGLFFKIFGPEITIARAIGIFFSILSVPAMFLFARRLFKNAEIALVAAFLTALNPLLVFFSHNTQLQNPGILFMILGGYFYIRWLESDANRDLIFTSLFVTLAALNVFTFLVILIPMLFTFPWERVTKFTISRLKAYGISAAILAAIPLWLFYMKFVGAAAGRTLSSVWGGGGGLVNLASLYVPQVRTSIMYFLADNFTYSILVLAAVGMAALGIMYLRKSKKFGGQIALPAISASIIIAALISLKLGFGFFYAMLFAFLCIFALPVFKKELHEKELEGGVFTEKFLFAYGLGTVVFFIIMSEKLSGHSYHQFPIAPFFVLAASYAITSISSNIADLFSEKFAVKNIVAEETATQPADVFKFVKYFAIIIFLLMAAYGLPGAGGLFFKSDAAKLDSFEARAKQFNTIFPGPEIAGDYIKAHAGKDDRVLLSGGEIMGLLWHADRKGFYGISSAQAIKDAESRGVKWIFVYTPLGRNELNNPEVLAYIQNNYALKQMAVAPSGDSFAPIYFLFEKGGTFSDQDLKDISSKSPPKTREYSRIGGGKVQILYVSAE